MQINRIDDIEVELVADTKLLQSGVPYWAPLNVDDLA